MEAGGKHQIRLTINGRNYDLLVELEWSLLHIIREVLGLTGTKQGCGKGECGMCTVIMNGKTVNSCMILGVEADGSEILTIEGLEHDGELHPLQKAFINADAIQCGMCTPGMILSAKALLDVNDSPTEADINKAMSGNLCRCTGYVKIRDAVMNAASELRGKDEE